MKSKLNNCLTSKSKLLGFSESLNSMHSVRRQAGVSLIEALISLLIFSVGALGLAALQLNALSASGDSQQRSIVLWKAQDLADRIRSNPNLANNYVTRIGNAVNTIGVDSAAGVIACESNQPAYVQPAVLCSDTVGGNAAECTDAQKVSFDIWEVFCEPNTGLAVNGAVNNVADGSAGVVNLEVALIQNSVAAGDPDDDMLLYFEWVSREADSIQSGATNVQNFAGATINTNLCGINRQVSASLDTYCLRFRP